MANEERLNTVMGQIGMSGETKFKFTYKRINGVFKYQVKVVDTFSMHGLRISKWHATYEQAVLEIKMANPMLYPVEAGLV